MACNASTDASFGPWAGPSCRGGTDFTLDFELIWFSYLPCALFIVATLWRCAYPAFITTRVARSGLLRTIKLLALGALAVANVVCLALFPTANAIGAASLELAAALCALYLSDRYHIHSPRSSTLVTVWLAVSCLLQVAIVRTQWLIRNDTAVAAAYTVVVVLKALSVLLENVEKRHLLVQPASYAPEETAAPLNRLLIVWVMPLFRQGYTKILSLEDLMPISSDLVTGKAANTTPLARRHKTLFQDLVMDMPRTFFVPVIARICLIGFSLAQPFLVHTTLEYVVNPAITRSETRGSLLIVGYMFVFGGFALSNALFWYLVTRLKLRARSRLIELIYDCLYKSSGPHPGNSVATSLMTVDVEVAMMGLECFHDTWASTIQIAAAVAILGVYLSWACVAPVIACLGALILTIPVVIYIQPAQTTWNASTAERLALTTAILDRLRDVRLLGLGGRSFSLVQRLRQEEIAKSTGFRKLLFLVIILSQSPLGMSPLITFIFYAVIYNTSANSYTFAIQAFTALNLIGLVVTPFTNLLQALPIFAAGFASLMRVQEYVDTARKDERNSLQPLRPDQDCALQVESASFGWTADLFVVKDVTTSLADGEFLSISGPVASGKSTFLAGLLGLVPNKDGRVTRTSMRVSYCPQTPWIFKGTVRENITCGTDFEQSWFDTVTAACALAEDIGRWTLGDLHDVGNDGRNLSGGQRQRVALARAVYSRHPLVFLDNPLSGLDFASAQHIQHAVLGRDGLLRRNRRTVVLVTSLADCIAESDKVILLAKDGTFAEQGAPTDLSAEALSSFHSMTTLRNPKVATQDRHPASTYTPGEDTGEGAAALAREDIQRKNGDWSIYWYYFKASGRLNTLVFILGSAGTAVGYQLGITWIKWWSVDLLAGHNHSNAYHLGIYGMITALGGVALAANAGASMVFMVTRSATHLHNALLGAVARAPVSYFNSIDTGVTINRFNQDLRLIDWELPLAMVNALGYFFICTTQAIIIADTNRYMALAVLAAVGALVVVQRFYLTTSRQLRLLDIEAKAPLYTNFSETIQGIPTIRAFGDSLGELLKRRQQDAVNRSQQPMFLLSIVQRWLALAVDLIVSGLAMILIILVIKDPGLGDVASLGVGLVNLTLFNQFLTFVIRFWTELENALGAISRVKSFESKTPTASGHREVQQNDNSTQAHDDVSLDSLQSLDARPATVVFERVTASYESASNSAVNASPNVSRPALDNISLTIPPGQRIGIVGRSGSGKSTLLSSLCRILPTSQGSIRIGGMDTAEMDQEDVQKGLICVTQDFFFLPDFSLKENLDPGTIAQKVSEAPPPSSESVNSRDSYDASDAAISKVLRDCAMWEAVTERDGLAANLDPAKWSTGELQLLNLARAVLKRRRLGHTPHWKILLLDEVTSSVDRHTASLMRQVIRKEFAGYTIIAVEHRLESGTEDLDWVVRLDKGSIVEQGTPYEIIGDA